MKLLFLIILLCGITSTPNYAVKAKKSVCHSEPTTANVDMIPAGLLFQF